MRLRSLHNFTIITVMINIRILLSAFFVGILLSANAQYWFGPKVGYHYTLHAYQDPNYKDDYRVSKDHNYELGVVVTYTASEKYAVHGELYYERIGNRVSNRDEGKFFVNSQSSYNFISFPILLRVSMGHQPVHWYVNGGPKLSIWTGGTGTFEYGNDESLNPDGIDKVDYDVVFTRSDAQGIANNQYFVNESNRLQYALTIGGGFYLDLANGARAMFDFRYNWGHSNMGFNDDVQLSDGRTIQEGDNIPQNGYQENYEYTHNTFSFSVAYMFEYSAELKRQGNSTSSESRESRKKAKKKNN